MGNKNKPFQSNSSVSPSSSQSQQSGTDALPSENQQWYLLSESGDPRGPFRTQELIRELEQRRIGPHNVVRPANQPENQPDAWDYVFAFVEFRDVIPKPVLPKKTVPSQQTESLFQPEVTLKAIVHDNVRILEGTVQFLSENELVVSDLANAKNLQTNRLFVHLYDPKHNRSVNLWTYVESVGEGEIRLSFRDLPVAVRNRYFDILNGYRTPKAA